jgi:hypothetical protein
MNNEYLLLFFKILNHCLNIFWYVEKNWIGLQRNTTGD